MKRRIISMWMAIILLLTTADLTAFAAETVSGNGMQSGSEETVSDNDTQNGSEETEDTGEEEEGTLSSNETPTVSGQCGDNVTWNYEDGTLTISGTGDMWHYDSDENLSPWYEYREEVTQLVLDENITRIGSHAFYRCSNLSGKLKIPGNVATIGTYAFWGCTGLTGLELSEGIIRITEGAFGGCTGLSGDLIIPDGVEVIAEWAFEGCSGLSSLEIPDGMEVICTRAFASCEGINRIVFQGEKPEFASYMGSEDASKIFEGITAHVYYPADDLTWDGIESVEGLGGNLTWIAVQPEKQKVDAPAADIKSGTCINEETIIQLTAETLDAKIYYTTDGTQPKATDGSPGGKLYTDGIKAKKVMLPAETESGESVVTIKAYAVKEGYADSKVVTFRYVVENESSRWGDIAEQDRKLYATEAMPQGDASKVPSGMWIAGIREEGYTYSGNNIVFAPDTEDEIRVYDGKTLLKLDQDYTISYKNNKKAYEFKEGEAEYKSSKAPSVTIKGKGNYSGSITRNFVINPADISALKEDGTRVYQVSDLTLAYNGKVQKGTSKVTYTDEKGKTVSLKANTDFSYVYPGTDETAKDYSEDAFKKAGSYDVMIVGKGNYTGTVTFKENITESILISKVKVASIPAQDYKKDEPAEPTLTLTYKGEPLTEYNETTKTGDYTFEFENNDIPGTARVIIRGTGSYAGERTVTFKINGYNIKKAKMEGFVSSYIYTGDEIKQDQVKFYGTDAQGNPLELEEGKHYTATYDEDKNTNAGTATVTYTGIAEEGWTGTIKKNYKIKAYDLNNDTEKRIMVTDEEGNTYPQSVKYLKNGAKPSVIIKYTSPLGREYILNEGTDYKLSYSNNKKVNDGTDEKKVPTIKITGKGNFRGTRQKEKFKITVSDISQTNITAADVVYQNKRGKFTTNVVITDSDGKKLNAGTDYEKSFKYYYCENVKLSNGEQRTAGTEVPETDIVLPGTVLKVVVTGKGNYAGDGETAAVVSDLYRVVEADIAKATVKVNKQYYTGKPIRPNKSQIVVTLNGNVLAPQDYSIMSYTNNINKGNAKLTIKGVGNYGGTKTVSYTIANKSMDYVIAFNANGATSGSMKDMKIKYGVSYTLTQNAYQRNGYDFIGWSTESDGLATDAQGNEILYKDEAQDPIVIGKNDIGQTLILYAQWKLTEYKITYHLDGGTNHEQNPASYTVEDKVELKEPTKEGYVFLGWYTDSSFSASKKITFISKGTKGDKVLYAKWRATSIKDVEIPEEYLNVNDFGAVADDDLDDTNYIEWAIRQASDNYSAGNGQPNTVYVPAGTYIITPGDSNNDGDPGISLKSNVNLVMDNNAILYVKATSLENYCVISAKYVENINIIGGRIQGERYRHIGQPGEYGHGIAIYAGKNIEISNVMVSDNCGDGIYLGTQVVRQADDTQAYLGCENIRISNCEIFNNRRSNISIVDADDVMIEQCYIADANGTAPQCGICIEPNYNSSDGICRNITIKDTTVNAYQNKNASDYMCFMTVHNPNNSNFVTADNIKFINCIFNGWVGNYSGTNLYIDANTVINGEFVNLKG